MHAAFVHCPPKQRCHRGSPPPPPKPIFFGPVCVVPCHSEVDWDIIWADVSWVRECMDHLRLEEHQVGFGWPRPWPWVCNGPMARTRTHEGAAPSGRAMCAALLYHPQPMKRIHNAACMCAGSCSGRQRGVNACAPPAPGVALGPRSA